MTEPGTRIVYEFNEFRLDLQQRLLLSGADGRPIPLSPKIFDTLLYFVERRGELLDKATLMKAIWPNIVVEENNLNQNISALRRALGESPGEHRFIVTEPGRGYRFVAEVRTLTIPARTSAQQQPAAEASTVLSTSQPTTPTSRSSIAVLPFANLTGDPGKEYFSDGMAEELIHVLARVPGLRVPSRTSSFAYKGRNVDLRQIATDLRVGAVLEGSVRSAGERIRVTAQLIDAESGYHLWSQNYDRQFEDLFELQDELAREIVRALRINLSREAQIALTRPPPTQDIEAYNLFMQASALSWLGDLRGAHELLQQAIARDPQFGRARAMRASLRAVAITNDIQLAGTLTDAEREIIAAQAFDPDDFSMRASLGLLYAAQGRWIEAEERFQEALAHDTTNPALRMSAAMSLTESVGHLQRSLDLALEAARLAPAWAASLMTLAMAYVFVGRHEEARRSMDRTTQLGYPTNVPGVRDVLGDLARHSGRYDEAASIMIDALTPALRDAGGAEVVKSVFGALTDRDSRGIAIEKITRLRADVSAERVTHISRRRFALWYTLLGAPAEAFEVANESIDIFARHGTIGMYWGFLWMPDMLPFRQDSRFQEFVRRLKLFDYWNQYGPPDNCELRNGKLICS